MNKSDMFREIVGERGRSRVRRSESEVGRDVEDVSPPAPTAARAAERQVETRDANRRLTKARREEPHIGPWAMGQG